MGGDHQVPFSVRLFSEAKHDLHSFMAVIILKMMAFCHETAIKSSALNIGSAELHSSSNGLKGIVTGLDSTIVGINWNLKDI